MVYNSSIFWLFFLFAALIYTFLPKKIRCIWLLIASYFFYMCWNVKYVVLIAFSTVVTYAAGLLIEHLNNERTKKWVVFGGAALNLGSMLFARYFESWFQNEFLISFSAQEIQKPFDILLPMGISFYTLQTLGYLIDVYRGDCNAERNFLQYALFISFFPQLAAGPIERSTNFLQQIRENQGKKRISLGAVTQGFLTMLWGMFMKLVIADRAALLVNGIFDHVFAIGTVEAILGCVCFAIQIYCSLGGYSAIAIGAAKIMGFELTENFNAPFFSVSIADYWRRWYISLGTWFRDYLYIPLSGNKKNKFCKYRNIVITFLCVGLWFGVSWNYAVWGILNGFFYVAGDILKPMREKILMMLRVQKNVFSFRLGQMAVTFGMTSFAGIFFRAESLGKAFLYLKNLFVRWNPWMFFEDDLSAFGINRRETVVLLAAVMILVVVDFVRYWKGLSLGEALSGQNFIFRWAVAAGLLIAVIAGGAVKFHMEPEFSRLLLFYF